MLNLAFSILERIVVRLAAVIIKMIGQLFEDFSYLRKIQHTFEDLSSTIPI